MKDTTKNGDAPRSFKMASPNYIITFSLRLTAVCVLCNLLQMSYLMFILGLNNFFKQSI